MTDQAQAQESSLPEDVAALEMAALEEAVKVAGGFGALAGRIGVAASAPSMWRKRGSVPAEHCPAIERETGVRCERLNRRVDWSVLRLQAGPTGEGQADESQPAP